MKTRTLPSHGLRPSLTAKSAHLCFGKRVCPHLPQAHAHLQHCKCLVTGAMAFCIARLDNQFGKTFHNQRALERYLQHCCCGGVSCGNLTDTTRTPLSPICRCTKERKVDDPVESGLRCSDLFGQVTLRSFASRYSWCCLLLRFSHAIKSIEVKPRAGERKEFEQNLTCSLPCKKNVQ